MEALNKEYLKLLDQIGKEIQESDQLAAYLDTESEEEFDVLKGGVNLLKNSTNLKILTEFAPHMIKDFGNPKEFLEFFVNNGFKIYDIKSINQMIEPNHLSQLLLKYPSCHLHLVRIH